MLGRFLVVSAAFGLAACFSPDLPSQIACGENGVCPPGLRCEAIANICVSNAQAAVAEMHFAAQPTRAEATTVAAPVVVELRNDEGDVVPLSGGTFAVELAANEQGVELDGSTISAATDGVVRFDQLKFDRPGTGLRLVVHGGDLQATSAAFDVTTTRAAVLGISVGGVVDSCATVTYRLQQAQSLPVDLLVELDPDGPEGPLPYRRATQAGSAPGKAGVDGVAGSPEGRALTFTWDTTADVGSFDVTGRLRITPSMDGVPGTAYEAPVTVRNGPRFFAFVHGVGEGSQYLFDDNYDGNFTYTAVDLVRQTIRFDTLEDFAIPEGASVNDFAIGDFDGDARFDLVVGLSTGTVVQHQLRTGGGHRGPSESVAASFRRVMTDDLDHDGLADIIGVEAGSGDVVILRSRRQAPGTLVEAARPWRGGDTASVKLADLDHDGWKDLVIARASATSPVVVVRGSAAGFGPPTTLDGLKGSVVDVADLDLDGRDDVASLDAGGLHVAASSGGRVDFPEITGTALGIHEVNGDRLPDVVVARGDNVYLHAHAPVRHAVAFVPPTRVGAAPGTTELIIGDYGGGDRSDIFALANGGPPSEATVVRFQNNRPRRCAARLSAPLTSGPDSHFGTTLGDVNGDGKVDRISFYSGVGDHGQLVAALGRGDGTFEAADGPLYEWAVGGQQRSLVSGDFDGDLRSDLAFTNGDGLVLLYNDRGSPGTFTHVDLPVEAPEGLAIADLDGDGAQDLVVLDTGRVQIRRGDPTDRRSFGPPTVLPTAFDTGGANSDCREGCEAHVADFDADGHPDILVRALTELFLFRADAGAADGYDAPLVAPFENYAPLMGISDVTGDGRPEAIIQVPGTETTPTRISGLALNPAGTALEPVWSTPVDGPVTYFLDIDIDGDGVEETITQTQAQAWNLIHGPHPELRALPWGAFSLLGSGFAVADVNSDGHEDLLSLDYQGTTVVRFDEHGPMDLGTLLTPRGKGEDGGFGNQVAIGDFDGDDLPDLAIRDSADGQIILRRQASDAPGTLAPDEVAVNGLYSSALADVDGDRRADLVTYGENASLFYLDPAAPASPGHCVTDFPAFPHAVGDVDRDGRPDIVESTWTDVVLRRDPADACAAPISIMTLDASPSSTWRPSALKLVDMNQDGFLDVVVATDAVRVALQDPDAPGSFSVTDYEAQDRTDYPPYFDFEVTDLNGDHVLDVVVIDVSYAVRIFSGSREVPGRLEPSFVMAEDNHLYSRTSISVGDLNDDGMPDVVVGGSYRNEVFLQESDSNPDPSNETRTFGLAYITTSANVSQFDVERATVVDFDQDGRNDVIYVDPIQGTMLLRGR
jgi:hypothetical protein